VGGGFLILEPPTDVMCNILDSEECRDVYNS
jgi:hypothetical protein